MNNFERIVTVQMLLLASLVSRPDYPFISVVMTVLALHTAFKLLVERI